MNLDDGQQQQRVGEEIVSALSGHLGTLGLLQEVLAQYLDLPRGHVKINIEVDTDRGIDLLIQVPTGAAWRDES